MLNEPIRVLHVLQRLEAGGVQKFLLNLYKTIDRTKVQFDFLVHYETPQFFDEEIKALGGKIYRLSFREDFNVIKYFRDLDRFFREHKEYAIVHGHMVSLGLFYLYFAKKHKVKCRIAHAHNDSTVLTIKRPYSYLKVVFIRFYKLFATDLFAASKQAARYMFGNSEAKIIKNAIEAKLFTFNNQTRDRVRQELGLSSDEMVVGNIARFTEQKNHSFTIDVFHSLMKIKPSAKLLLVGDGYLQDSIIRKVESMGIARSVLFLGTRKDIPAVLMAMDVFLFPSIFEGLGIVAIESQAAGTPVVCTATLPEELNVTPIIKRMDLNASSEKWADALLEAAINPMSHKDTSKMIIDAGFDTKEQTVQLQELYLDKFDEVERERS